MCETYEEWSDEIAQFKEELKSLLTSENGVYFDDIGQGGSLLVSGTTLNYKFDVCTWSSSNIMAILNDNADFTLYLTKLNKV